MTPAPRPSESWPGEAVELPDRSMYVRHAPATEPGAEPAVMVHGLGGSSMNWTDLMAALSDRLETWAPDLNGFGWSPPPRDGDYSPAGHARGVAEVIEATAGGPVHLFGNSLGGAVCVQLAARRPDLVRSLTLVSPALPSMRAQRGNVHLPVIAVPGVGESLVRRYLRVDAELRARATIDACFADPSRMSADRMAEAVEEVRRRDSLPYLADAFLSSLRGLMTTFVDRGPNRPWRLAERIGVPVLLVYGRTDKLVDPKAAHRATRHFRDAHVVLVPDSGHVAQMEHPELVAEAWRTFLGWRPAPAAPH
ncbi:MAG: alpha/beta fold hydrolase [Candidatus Nanopelagicales bacterium]